MKNYDNFLLGVTNLKEARKYYETVLGLNLKFDFSQKGMIAFSIGNEEPAIILKDENIFNNTKPTIWLEVESVEIEYKKSLKNGVNFLLNLLK